MTEQAQVTPAAVSEQIFEYRRLSELIRRVYLDETDDEFDVDEFGDRMAKRGLVVSRLAHLGQRMVIRWLSEEDHLYWRLNVLYRKLRERGAAPLEIKENAEVEGIHRRLDSAEIAISHLIRSAGGRPE